MPDHDNRMFHRDTPTSCDTHGNLCRGGGLRSAHPPALLVERAILAGHLI
jgi:hypothetical protein